jgi:hypothetical protein
MYGAFLGLGPFTTPSSANTGIISISHSKETYKEEKKVSDLHLVADGRWWVEPILATTTLCVGFSKYAHSVLNTKLCKLHLRVHCTVTGIKYD